MRLKVQQQLGIVFSEVTHRRGSELRTIDQLLTELGAEALDGVYADLVAGVENPSTGRPGLSADLILRALILKRLFAWSYEELEFRLRDSATARAFCRLAWNAGPSKSSLHAAIKLVRPATLETINRLLVRRAMQLGVESAKTIATDSTAVSAEIRSPTDSGLLLDVITVGTRLLRQASAQASVAYVNHTRLARRHHLAAHHARRKNMRVPHYRRLIWAARRVVKWCTSSVTELSPGPLQSQIDELIRVGRQVVSQARRRVLKEESVPAAEKVVSIHQPDVDIIVKDNRNTFFGHKLFASMGLSGMILDLAVPRGNPADAATTVECIERLVRVTGAVPDEVTMDGGFASRANLHTLREIGVRNVCFSKRRGLEVADMVDTPRTYRRLRNFRSRIEAAFSWLKRTYGLHVCNWRGIESFRAYAWSGALTYNLVVLARAGPSR